jgi:hypothetical protein
MTDREGVVTEASQKTCRFLIIHSMLSGEKL